MNHKISRRDLFTKGAKRTAAAGIAAVALPQAVKGATGSELATLLDLRKCIGCEACVYACKDSNAKKYPEPVKPFPVMHPVKRVKVEDWSENRDETTRLTPYTWLYIQRVKVYYNGKEQELNIPRRCMHCENPPCANLCPWGSAHKQSNGITVIDTELCFGGAKCKDVCPWKIPQRQTGVGIYLKFAPSLGGNGVMYKCDRCYDKIAQGEIPACITECPEGVQKIGPREDIIREAKAIALSEGVYLYGLEENGGTNTIYISPVPFDVIDRALEKGDGKPHIQPVADSMASADLLSKAMVIAPLAGIAAAAGKNFRMLKKIFSPEKENNE
ncbi:MAG: 4Fe-4S dicluster domain-containing protein [Spirochaetes bacterium]|nr:4Fe-4S dicluster domain-containing protein [Spirochaetota bacterium]